MSADVVIEVTALRKRYGGHEAVKGINLHVNRGEVFAFLGPNGAGKTTSVEIFEGYRERDDGDVRVLGVDPASADLAWRARIGVVLQETRPEPALTVRESIAQYAGFYADPRPVEQVIELVGLEESADVRAGKLSGGQQRRLDVALGIVGRPEVLFLDEPTTGFDPAARREAWAMLEGLKHEGLTIFLTTHYLEEAEALADRVAVIAGGQIVAEGTPANLGGRDAADSEIGFRLGETRRKLPASLAGRVTVEPHGRHTFRSPDAADDLAILLDWARDARVSVFDIEVSRPSLEDVYLQLAGEK